MLQHTTGKSLFSETCGFKLSGQYFDPWMWTLWIRRKEPSSWKTCHFPFSHKKTQLQRFISQFWRNLFATEENMIKKKNATSSAGKYISRVWEFSTFFFLSLERNCPLLLESSYCTCLDATTEGPKDALPRVLWVGHGTGNSFTEVKWGTSEMAMATAITYSKANTFLAFQQKGNCYYFGSIC